MTSFAVSAGNVFGLAGFLLLGAAANASAAGPETVLHAFTDSDGNGLSWNGVLADGGYPMAGLIKDGAGNLYGTAEIGGAPPSYGVVFELSPHPNRKPGYKILYAFTGNRDGAYPEGALTFDKSGNLYGTTVFGGSRSQGAVFEISPNDDGKWTLTRHFDFHGGTGGGKPSAGVILDAAGNVYGTTEQGGIGNKGFGYGAVFKLVPAGAHSWSEQHVYDFHGGDNGHTDGEFPNASLVMDRAGDLYGTAPYGGLNGQGIVFKIHDDGTAWHERTLYDFTGGADGGGPKSSLILDKSGNLYGTAAFGGGGNASGGAGTVFELSAPRNGTSSAWTLSPLYSFTGGADGGYPYSGLVFDKSGNLYGDTAAGGDQSCGTDGCGVVFQLQPAANGWNENVLWRFTGSPDGATPVSNLMIGKDGRLLGTASEGGSAYGVVFQVAP